MKRIFCLLLALCLLMAPVQGASLPSIRVEAADNGSVQLSAVSAAKGETVRGTVEPMPGYEVATVRCVTKDGYFFAELTENSFSFPMPGEDVTVKAEFISCAVWDGAVDVSWYDPQRSEFTLSKPAELAGLAALVNGLTDASLPDYRIKGDRSLIRAEAYPEVLLVGAGGGNVRSTVYCSQLDFAYKTVYLSADLDMGGRCDASGNWSGPNYTPIGGKYSMLPDEVSGDSFVIDTRFNGVLDGQGHTVSNIYCQRYAAKGFPYSMAIGLVGYLGGAGDVSGITADFCGGWQPAVRNVTVGAGYLYGRRMVGGVVGRVGKTANGVLIENCANLATVKNTDAKGVGGIVGAGWGSGKIRNCYNSGNVSTVFACPAGGICASNSGLDIYNCYNVGTINSNGALRGRAIGGHDAGSYRVENCWYLSGCDDDEASKGWYRGSSKVRVSVGALSAGEMKSAEMLKRLNQNGTAFVADTAGLNDGYPILWYQAERADGSCCVTVGEAEGGALLPSAAGVLPCGTLIGLAAQPDAGYTFQYYTVNGARIPGDFWLADGDCEISAVFATVSAGTLRLAESREYSLSVRRTGYKPTAEGVVWVENEALQSGDKLLEENILTVSAYGWTDVSPADKDMEYTDAFRFSAEGAEALGGGQFVVSGGGDVGISAVRGTERKSWLRLADTNWYDGSGSYTLTTAAELAGLAELVNSGRCSFAGETVTLGADISLKNCDGSAGTRTWKGIGVDSERAFMGVFDGNGHSVSDMEAWSSGSYAALFGYLRGAAVRNLEVRGKASCEASSAYAAGLAACASASALEDCVSRVEVDTPGQMAGGIAAYISDGSTVRRCQNYGTVTGESGVGGVVGVCYSDTDVIDGCENYGPVCSPGSGSKGTGGIVGKLAGTVVDCGNAGEVRSADRYTGGLVGYSSGRNSAIVKNCCNIGVVYASSTQTNAASGALVGYAQYLDISDSVSSCDVVRGEGYTSKYCGGALGRAGEVTQSGADIAAADRSLSPVEYLPEAAEAREFYTVTFVADGKTVAVLDYQPGAAAVGEPELPEKAGYTGFWDTYELGERDITVQAVYRLRALHGGNVVSESGSYGLQFGAEGLVTLAPGVNVTLEGGSMPSKLRVTAGVNALLTLHDVVLDGEGTLLTLDDGVELTLTGENRLEGSSDLRENQSPTVYLSGRAAVNGNGSLRISSGAGNAAVQLGDGAALALEGGSVTVAKRELLGMEGGAVNAPEGAVLVSGGSLSVYTDSDNVSAICASSLTVTSGSLLARCVHSRICLTGGTVLLNGGLTRLTGGEPRSTGGSAVYADAETVCGLGGAGGFCRRTAAFEAICPGTQRVLLNEAELAMQAYNIDGSNYYKLRDLAAALAGTSAQFSLDYDGELRAMYLVTGGRYARVGGEGRRGADAAATAVPSDWSLFVNGQLTECQVYNIGGSNYFKLRELAAALALGIDYDDHTRTIRLSSAS